MVSTKVYKLFENLRELPSHSAYNLYSEEYYQYLSIYLFESFGHKVSC